MVANESRSVRWVGEPCEPAALTGVKPCASLRAQGVEATVGAVDGVLLLLQLFGVTRHMYCPFLRKLRAIQCTARPLRIVRK